jgi:hypothetical protein
MKILSRNPAREVNQLMKKLSKQPIGDDTGLNMSQRELNQLRRWEKSFRADAYADNYELFRNHLKRLQLGEKPKLMLEGTIRVMQAIWIYNTIDQLPLTQFIDMQQYDPSKAPNASYVFTFNLNGTVYARILVDSTLVIPDLADLYDHLFYDYKTVGYGSVSMSLPDWSPLTNKEFEDLENEVTDDLRYDYPEENDLHFFFDKGPDNTYLILGFYDEDEDEE